MAISAVVFDWYATLAMPNPDDFWIRLADEIADAGGEPDDGLLAAWDLDHPVEHLDHSTDEASYRAWQRARLDAVFAGCGVADPARTALLDRIDAQRYTRVYDVFPDVSDVLAGLRDRGVTVGICSNWDWDLDRHLVRNGIADRLDFVVCSAQLGYRKPHPAVFGEVLDRAGTAAPDEVVFVGDSWHDDVTGSRAAGLRPVHVVRAGACRVDGHDGVPCTSTVADVLRLLD
jgi:putative hydrolase of the HAD superfamily